MFKVAILLGFAAVCWAQVPTPCDSPKQWEGRRVMTDQSKSFQEIAKYSYDAENLRTRAIEEREVGRERDYYDVLHLYKENKEYRLNLKTRKCNVSTPRHPFFETRVPPGSKFLFEAEAGVAQVPGEHLTVQNWDITFDDGAKYAIAVTSPDCVPIFAAYYSKEVGFLIENFFDIHAGISDPSVFIPPQECMGLPCTLNGSSAATYNTKGTFCSVLSCYLDRGTSIITEGQKITASFGPGLQFRMKLFVCLALIVVCSAQVPQRCESPKQWTGRRVRSDRYQKFFEIASHTYDEVNMRTRSIEEIQQGIEKDYYDVIHLHALGTEYRLNLRTKQCNVTKMTRPFRPIGVPLDARFLYEAEFGAAQIPSEHITTLFFDGKSQDGAQYYVQVTTPDCVPINFDVRSNSTDEHFHETYYDVRIGISDPTVFIPPQECNKHHV
ncbi:uncharacterized protein LOC123564650 [Mercenaria mercenaria]|uniref:uncharacterized protein LOC123564650 n=1 Tax=Mercenaria mercenaria TaxID=6596 RepID=UPI001E1D51DE|nr:uncharacterized protein LOC123564650 [Mercenaria mercenaria]